MDHHEDDAHASGRVALAEAASANKPEQAGPDVPPPPSGGPSLAPQPGHATPDAPPPPSGGASFAPWFSAIFSGCLVLITGLQALNFVASERAFIAPSNAEITVKETIGVELLPIMLELKNSGKNTATINEFTAAITHHLPPRPEYPEGPEFAFPPVVSGGIAKRILQFKTAWGEATATAVKSGALPLYIFGRIRYSDPYSWLPFHSRRETGFCFVYTPNSPIASFETCLEPAFTWTQR
jgi:hypothetical protein